MKLIIAGSRTLKPCIDLLGSLIYMELGLVPTEIVCGEANGVDKAGERFAKEYNTDGLPVAYFPADWEMHGRSAGPIRNRMMAEYGDALLLIWDGKSAGSNNMKGQMKALGKPVYEVILR